MLVRTIADVPDSVFDPALAEINSINWQAVRDPSRKNSAAFATSTSIHLRRHRVPDGPLPKSIEEWSVITECEDTPDHVGKYSAVRQLADWMVKQAGGLGMGRIMIVNLAARGHVPIHIDPLDYFVMYSRFHVPFKTNEMVTFSGGPGTAKEHMPYKKLSQLNNRLPHQLYNGSNENRIHVIVDIALKGGNQIF